jgi:flagellar assembly factor FliW
MQLNTKLFGEITVEQDKIIKFESGLPGFENLREFLLVIIEQTKPIFWLQAIEEDIALPVISPFDVDPAYSPTIDDEVFNDISLDKEEDLLVLAVARIPEELSLMTANLAAPILINSVAGKGCQVLAEGDDYQIRQPVFEVLLKKSEEDG